MVDDGVVQYETAPMLPVVKHPVGCHFLERSTQILSHRPQKLEAHFRNIITFAEAAARNYLEYLPQAFFWEVWFFFQQAAQILGMLEQIFVPREDGFEIAFDPFVADQHQLFGPRPSQLLGVLCLNHERPTHRCQ